MELKRHTLIVYTISFISLLIYAIPIVLFNGSYYPIGEPDAYFIWETVYRMAIGQIPHQDFFSPPGFFPSVLPAIIYKILGVGIDRAFLIGQCLNTIGATLVALWLTRGTSSIWGRLLIVLSITALVGSPAEMEMELIPRYIFWTDSMFSFQGIYDIIAAALLGLILFRFAYKPQHEPKALEAIDTMLVGLLLTALLFSKITYFILGLLFFAPLAYYLFPENRQLMRQAIIVFLIALLALEFSYGHVVSGYFLDTITLLQTYHLPLNLEHTIIRHLTGLIITVSMVTVIGISAYCYKQQALRRLFFYMLPWPIAYLLINNHDTFESVAPLFTSLGLYVITLNHCVYRDMQLPVIRRTHYLLIITILSLPILSRVSVHFNAITKVTQLIAKKEHFTLHHVMDVTPEPKGYLAHAKQFKVLREECWRLKRRWLDCWGEILQDGPTHSLAQYLQDALRLIWQVEKQQGEPVDHLLTFDFTNPFMLLLQRTPVKAIPVWFNPATYSHRCRPSVDGIFSHANYVLVPEYAFVPDTVLDFTMWYGDALQERYTLVAESKDFKLYKKKKAEMNRQKTKRYMCVPYKV